MAKDKPEKPEKPKRGKHRVGRDGKAWETKIGRKKQPPEGRPK